MAFLSFEQIRKRLGAVVVPTGGGLSSLAFNVLNGVIVNKFYSVSQPVTIDFNFTGGGGGGYRVRVFQQVEGSGQRLFQVFGDGSFSGSLSSVSLSVASGLFQASSSSFVVQLPFVVQPVANRSFTYNQSADRFVFLGRTQIFSEQSSPPTVGSLPHLFVSCVTTTSLDRGIIVVLDRRGGVAGRGSIFQTTFSGGNITSGETLNLEAETIYPSGTTTSVNWVCNFRSSFSHYGGTGNTRITRLTHIRLQHYSSIGGDTRLSQQVFGIEAFDLRQWSSGAAWFLYSFGGDNLFHGRMRINEGNFVLTGGGGGNTALPTLRSDTAMMSIGHDMVSSPSTCTQGIVAISSFRPGGATTDKYAPGCLALQEYSINPNEEKDFTIIAPSSKGVIRFWTASRSTLAQGRLETDFVNSWYLNGNEWLAQMPSFLQSTPQNLTVYNGQVVTLEEEVLYGTVTVEAGGTLILKCRLFAKDHVYVYGTIKVGYGNDVNTKWLPSNSGYPSSYVYSIGTNGGKGGNGTSGNGQNGYSIQKLSTDPNAPILDVPSLYYLRAFRTTTNYPLVGGGAGGYGGSGDEASGGAGGRPGGILMIVTRWLFLLGNGKLEAVGEPGYNGQYYDDSDFGGGGGGGAGGVVVLLCGERHMDGTFTINVNGGAGGLAGKPNADPIYHGQPGQTGKIYLRYYV